MAVLLSLKHDNMIAIEWFKINDMKINADKCHLKLSGFRHPIHLIDLGKFKIWESRKKESKSIMNYDLTQMSWKYVKKPTEKQVL